MTEWVIHGSDGPFIARCESYFLTVTWLHRFKQLRTESLLYTPNLPLHHPVIIQQQASCSARHNTTTRYFYRGGSNGGQEGPSPPVKFMPHVAPIKVQDKAATCQNYITYPVVQRESISCVPPDESVATPVAPRMKTPEPTLYF